MLRILQNRVYARLLLAQIIALLGTGLLTIALGLLAYGLAGERAGTVLGIALTIKMAAYVCLSPVMTALIARFDRRRVLIAADLIRAASALALPFIDAVWQVYLLIFILQAASATFTPTFQAVIPEVLPDEADYTRALSVSRLAYDLESLMSPVLAGLLLTLIAPSGLFAGTALGFAASAALVLSVALPAVARAKERPFLERLIHGGRIYLATPRLRGLLALNVTVAATGAVVIVLSVVVAKSIYQGTDRDLAVLLGAHGAGSMLSALALPRLLDRLGDRAVMLAAAALAAGLTGGAGLLILVSGWPNWGIVLAIWAVSGAAASAVLTPSGRVLRRSAQSGDRPAIFAAQFALSHVCWLAAYPISGMLGSAAGVAETMLAMALPGAAGVIAAIRFWPADSRQEIEHAHDDLPPGHPHLKDAVRQGGAWIHRHAIVIDDEHRVWPTSG